MHGVKIEDLNFKKMNWKFYELQQTVGTVAKRIKRDDYWDVKLAPKVQIGLVLHTNMCQNGLKNENFYYWELGSHL